jgi:peroxiredoxin
LELDALQEVIGDIKTLGANLIAISPQLPEFSRKLISQKNLTFDLLSDPGNNVAKTFGIVFTFPEDLKNLYLKFGIDVAKHNGDDSWTLPMPARFIIDQSATIRYAQVDPDYTVRPEPEHTIDALKALEK